MKAFIDTPITKEKFLKHLRWHQDQDAFVGGTYGEVDKGIFKGCAVGCSIHSIQMELNNPHEIKYGNHKLYEEFLNIPEWLAHLEDVLFEGLPQERQKTWPVEFGEAINVGSELDSIKHPYMIYLMSENLRSLDACKYDEEKWPQVKRAIDKTREALQLTIAYHKSPNKKANLAALTAFSAALTAFSAALTALHAACSAMFRRVLSALHVAESAASAENEAYNKHADKLLELMRECK